MLPLRPSVCAAALLLSATLAHATVSESPVFALDTRDSNSTHVAESGVFALDTRLIDGLSDDGNSGTFVLDTRALTPSGLVIVGPSVCPSGASVTFQAKLQFGTSQEDVTALAVWSATGAPLQRTGLERTIVSGNRLLAGLLAPWGEKVFLTASYRFANGQIASNTQEVTIGDDDTLPVGLSNPRLTYLRPEGTNVVWRIEATAYGQAVTTPGAVLNWFLDGQALNVHTSDITREITGPPATHILKVTGADTLGRSGEDERSFTLSRPDPNEPGEKYPAHAMEGVTFQDYDGSAFEFDAAKIPNGLVVLAHGLQGSPNDEWIQDMSLAIQSRMADEGKPPNVVIYGWEDGADPSRYYGDLADPDFLERLIKIDHAVVATLLPFGVGEFLNDITAIKPHGEAYGITLADWIKTEIDLEHIDPSKPMHLIGHSAGGFVVGAAALSLENWNAATISQVTMLDTPLPYLSHLTTLSSTTKVEQYVSSWFGAQAPILLDTDQRRRRDLLSFFGVLAGPLVPTLDAHSYSHDWYTDTVREWKDPEDGWRYSPLLDNAWPEPGAPSSFAALTSKAVASGASAALDGFAPFGDVTFEGGFYVLSEADSNAGIQQTMTLPIGAESLTFHYRFTSPGDGDYLVVQFGDSLPLFIGPDVAAARATGMDAVVSLAGYEGQTGILVIKLVSQGQSNAIVSINSIELTTTDDPDADGLTTAQEQAAGTNPLAYSSDADSLSDADEVNLYFTNPMLADTDGDGARDNAELTAGTDPTNGQSYLRVTDLTKNAGGALTLKWASQTGRFYNVQRSADVTFATFDVIAQGAAATAPQNTFVDASAGSAPDGRYFYRIEVYAP